MREIKFRAWNGDNMNYNIIVGKFGAFWVNSGINNNGLDENDSASLSQFNTKCLDSTDIMQFTGIKDKNGKDIYEGDILKGGAFVAYEVKWDGYENRWNIGAMAVFFEVIGNIFENPELIK